jgi:hypothetical protein
MDEIAYNQFIHAYTSVWERTEVPIAGLGGKRAERVTLGARFRKMREEETGRELRRPEHPQLFTYQSWRLPLLR